MHSDLAKQSAGSLSCDVYHRVSELLVMFAGCCEDRGCPLNEVQKVLLSETALLAFDGTEASLAEMLTAENDLRDLPPRSLGWQPDPRAYRDPEERA